MFNETDPSGEIQPNEKIIAECQESIQQLLDKSGFQSLVEVAGQFGEIVDNQNWDQRVETTIKGLENRNQQVRAEINFKLTEALFFLTQNQPDRCVGALTDASDNAYNQSQMEGFEDLEALSDEIDQIIKKLPKNKQ